MKVQDLFSDVGDSATQAERFDEYKKALDVSMVKSLRGEFTFKPGDETASRVSSPADQLEHTITHARLNKSADAAVLDSLTNELEKLKAAEAELVKDITLTSPLSSGLVPIDLEPAAKILVPRDTPLRNRVPRSSGKGKQRTFKRITGLPGSGQGIARMRASINETTTSASGALTLRRGPKITYQADEKNMPYKQFGLSDVATWAAELEGLGFDDVRQLSQTALLIASMLADEHHMLGSRGTDAGLSGAIAAPAGLTLTARAAAGNEVGLQGGRYWVKVTAMSHFGESVLSASIDIDTVTAGQVVDVKVGTEPVGTLGYKVYAGRVAAAGADPGDAAKFSQGTTGYNTFTLVGNPLVTTGDVASAIVADTTATADEYDGLLATLLDPAQSGSVQRLNAVLSTSNPGNEFQNSFAAVYDAVKARPELVRMNGFDRKQLSDTLKAGTTTPGYRLEITQDEISGVRLGSLVSGIYNEITGDSVDVEVHPWLAQGNSTVESWSLPIPDTGISSTVQFLAVQDYMAINWPVIQLTYDVSSYWIGGMAQYAPKWSAAVVGIKKAA